MFVFFFFFKRSSGSSEKARSQKNARNHSHRVGVRARLINTKIIEISKYQSEKKFGIRIKSLLVNSE